MYQRMLDKNTQPDPEQIREYIGEDAGRRLCELETRLAGQYSLSRELRFPFGNHYGWGYKYSHKSFHLCYVFFEKNAITVMVQIGDKQVAALENKLSALTPKAKEIWAGRYPCGEYGGWIQYRILENEDLSDIMQFIEAKKPPKK